MVSYQTTLNRAKESSKGNHCHLFLLCVNNIVDNFQYVDGDDCVRLLDLIVFVILFADDTVLFSKTPGQLQSVLDQLEVYCDRWSIDVNTDTTK
jgi:hypothetical protein